MSVEPIDPMPIDPMNDEPLSKTARKREAERLQNVGRRLGELSDDLLSKLTLPDDLRAAVKDYQRFPSHGARRRQLQFIGKLMRGLDTDAIEAQLQTLDGESAEARYQFNQLEQWRDRLLTEPRALTEFISAYPSVDRQQLRTLLKKNHQAKGESQRKSLARQLFRFLRDSITTSAE